MDIKAIKNSIKTILNTVSELQGVYGYYEPHPTGFPSAMIQASNGTEERVDTISNESSISFYIDIITRNLNSETGVDALYDAVTATFNELRKDDHDTLSGLVHAFDVSPDFIFEYSDTTEPIYYCRLTVTARKLSNINL